MTIRISLHYRTAHGESLVCSVGGRAFEMEETGGGLWEAVLSDKDFAKTDQYTFEVRSGEETVRREWRAHTLVKPLSGDLVIRDRWLHRPADSAFWSSAFKDVIFGRGTSAAPKAAPKRTSGNVTFRFAAPEIRPGEAVALAGSGKALGDWGKMIPMEDGAFPWWSVTLKVTEPFEYKFVIVDKETKRPLLWEKGGNRLLAEASPAGVHLVVADGEPEFPALPWRGAGTAIPVFSLRTEDSFGIGEFHDLLKLVDWAAATGQHVIQLLPVNDTTMTGTWQDSYPYNANSSFALHPQFLHLPGAGVPADEAYRTLQKELNALPQVDYERVNGEKTRLLREAFARTDVRETEAYREFVERNRYWLLPYAVFCVLRDAYGTADYACWGEYAVYSAGKAAAYAETHQEEVDFYCFEQYLLDMQLKEAVRYAHRHGVILKGDLPIGVSRTSADAWTFPSLFHLDSSAGAPPDAFSADGQNWGFPTYNWEEMARDGFSWWKKRLRKMSEYFDAFRIDHILGFFRIWEIPVRYRSGLMGHFSPALPYTAEELRNMGFDLLERCYTEGGEDVLFLEDPRRKGYYHPRISAQYTSVYASLDDWHKDRFNELYDDFFYRRHNRFWKESACRKLPDLLRSTGMLACGEDLGMIPDCVPETMAELNILSLEIQRMPKDVHQLFGDPAFYPYWCVAATGTHDTLPLRAWWEEDRNVTQEFYRSMLHRGGEAPFFCEPWICEEIVRAHLKSPAMLTILPLQDWLSIDGEVRYPGDPKDERINVPAIPRYYWRYRMHLTLESLLARDGFNARLKELIEEAGRNR